MRHIPVVLDEHMRPDTNLCWVLPLLEKILFGFSKELLDCGGQNHKASFSGVCVCVCVCVWKEWKKSGK